MRIATWNVNSLKARLEKVTWWLERARSDVLLMQETKLADAAVPLSLLGSTPLWT
jgi:exodeoxyribonuclease III